jgi:hypothetical protein
VPTLAQDVQPGAHGGADVVLTRPRVDLLRLVVEPAGVVDLRVQMRGEARDAEPDAGALGSLVVELPPGIEVGRASLLEAHAVPGADLGQAPVAGDPPMALGVLLGLVELDVPVDADDRRRRPDREGQRGQREVLHVLPVRGHESTERSGHGASLSEAAGLFGNVA